MIRPRAAIVLAALATILILLWTFTTRDSPGQTTGVSEPVKPLYHQGPKLPLGQRVICRGPRGKPFHESLDDRITPEQFDIPYPKSRFGSHEELSLDQTWMTADEKYGPYGFNEDKPEYSRSRVLWDNVDWADLQNACVGRNRHRFGSMVAMGSQGRLALRPIESRWFGEIEKPMGGPTGRTAIVLRGWDSYQFALEDMMNIRSLIVEAALRSGGEYAVFLLVHVRDKGRGILKSQEKYDEVLRELVPPELQGIAVLFDDNLLESWYPKAETHHPNFQIYQALQAFAHFYNEYDHYWQLELDVRFTGDTLRYLDSLSNFAKKQPRKQAKERASFFYMPSVHGTYANFTATINASISGGSSSWGPVLIDDVVPVGPKPPVPTPEEDDFSWGVDEDADLIVMNPCANVTWTEDWVYRDWIFGFKKGVDTPRMLCPPAISRSSRLLLNVVHEAQATKGLAVPSEATLSSFALWHGLKYVYPPQPLFQNPQRDPAEMDLFFNGGPEQLKEGVAKGDGMYNAQPHYDITNTATFWWSSPFPSWIWRSWLDGTIEEKMPHLLRVHEGRVYAPNLALHPVKTNNDP